MKESILSMNIIILAILNLLLNCFAQLSGDCLQIKKVEYESEKFFQNRLDECYMSIALNLAVSVNPSGPFGSIIVDHHHNEIKCFGVWGLDKDNVLLHGEMSAMFRCIAQYPSPTHNDFTDPGLHWQNMTLYTTGEPCPMCAAAIIWRKIGRVVYASNMDTLRKLGFTQMNRRVVKTFRDGVLQVPLLKGDVLREPCDRAFYSALNRTYIKPSSEDMLNGQLSLPKEEDDHLCTTEKI